MRQTWQKRIKTTLYERAKRTMEQKKRSGQKDIADGWIGRGIARKTTDSSKRRMEIKRDTCSKAREKGRKGLGYAAFG